MSKPITAEAHEIIKGARRDSYGPVRDSFKRIAVGWSQIVGKEVTPKQVALCMVWLKLMREVNKHSRDNLVDICGYAELAGEIEEP